VSHLPTPGSPFNPITSVTPLTPTEIFAGPAGLVAFLPLIPLLLLMARRWPRAALLAVGVAWMLPTLRWQATLVLLAGVGLACGWVLGLGLLRRRGLLGERGMIALVWVGLHALVLPLWWYPYQPWYPSRMAVLHNAGFSYFLLRMIAWGVGLAREPDMPARLRDTFCWLVYPPCMRLGPVVRREEFLERLDRWDVRQSPAWLPGTRRFGWFLLGCVGLALAARHIPPVLGPESNFFSTPEQYPTDKLLRAFYLVPIEIYLLLWTYNELACALSLWVGIPVDNNFDKLPLATSIRDFWRRWHITVGAWLRDYIYIPLGGNRRNALLNPFLVFAYCGIWHGASWSFLAWGVSQALGMTVERGWAVMQRRLGWRGQPRNRPWTAFCWLLTMHYQIATIVMFVDFQHLGLRLFAELWRRLVQAAFG
jgi:alginate O-acetyltransferase complex protein AlgI